MSDLFSVADADSDAIVKYHVIDQSAVQANSGIFVLSVVAVQTYAVLEFTAAQFSQLTYQGGTTAGDIIQVQANEIGRASWRERVSVNPAVDHAHEETPTAAFVSETERGNVYAISDLLSVAVPEPDASGRV